MGAQVFIDQFLHHPFMYFPAFYTIKELVTKEKPDVYRAIFVEYAGNMKEDVSASGTGGASAGARERDWLALFPTRRPAPADL
jgi:hypothetical protein